MPLSLLGCRDGQAYVRLSGPVDTDVLDRVQSLVRAMDDVGVHRFLVDVTGAQTQDLRLIRLMHRMQDDVRRSGGGVDLHGVGPGLVPSWAGLTLRETFAVHEWTCRPMAPLGVPAMGGTHA